MYQKYTGIILKRVAFNEADELLTVYTREAGKLRVKVRSIRKPQSRLAGFLQTLNEVEFEVASSATRRIGGPHNVLPVLTNVRIKRINSYLRHNLRKFAHALVGAETIYRISPDQERNEAVYDHLIDFFSRLGSGGSENFELRRFQLLLLSSSGFNFPLEDEAIDGSAREQIRLISNGGEIPRLEKPTEKAIDEFLNYVLEREIRSNKFVDAVE